MPSIISMFKPNTHLLFTISTNSLSFITSEELSDISEQNQIYQLAIPARSRKIEIYVRRRTDREPHFWGHVWLPYKVMLGRLLVLWTEISVVDGTVKVEEIVVRDE
jgi:hypothetical protein